MTGIFDSIIDSITGMDESTLLKGGAAAFKALNASKTQSKNSISELHSLNDGSMNGLGTNSVQASKATPAQSVSYDDLEAHWLQRLNRFANMQGSTAVKPR